MDNLFREEYIKLILLTGSQPCWKRLAAVLLSVSRACVCWFSAQRAAATMQERTSSLALETALHAEESGS